MLGLKWTYGDPLSEKLMDAWLCWRCRCCPRCLTDLMYKAYGRYLVMEKEKKAIRLAVLILPAGRAIQRSLEPKLKAGHASTTVSKSKSKPLFIIMKSIIAAGILLEVSGSRCAVAVPMQTLNPTPPGMVMTTSVLCSSKLTVAMKVLLVKTKLLVHPELVLL